MKKGITIQLTEYICGYCQKNYIAKRSDSNYCSHSCRQLAYVQRKATTPVHLPESSIKETKSNYSQSVNNDIKQTSLENNFSNELVEIIYRRNNINILETLLYDPSPYNCSFWVSVRYKYLIECLLKFSEAPLIYMTDLKEVYSALIAIQQSSYFMCLPFRYPYTKEIRTTSNILTAFCMNMEAEEPFKFEVSKSTKLQFMAINYELESFIPKNSYSQLSFST